MFKRISIRAGLFAGDLIIIVTAMVIASWLRLPLPFGKSLPQESVWLPPVVYGLAALVWAVSFSLADIYNLSKNLRSADEITRLVVGHAIATLAFAGALYFSFRDTSRLQVAVFATVSLLLLMAFRLMFRLLLYAFGDRRYGVRRVLIAGANETGLNVAHVIEQHRWTGLQLVGFVDKSLQINTQNYLHLGVLDDIEDVVKRHRIDEVILALSREAHQELANLAAVLHNLNVNVRVVPDLFDLVFLRSVVENLGDIPLVTLKEPVLNPLQRVYKRTFDLLFGFVALVISLPVMAFIAIGVKLDSPGPIIFRQQRVGENGRLFDMYKFRTMTHNPDEEIEDLLVETHDNNLLHKFYDDPRVTHFGRVLRQLSLDELPQFFNVIKGDMSLVGPRPELPWLVSRYEPWQRKRFEVPQGLTGWWQVNGRADKPMHLNTQDDLYYIRNYSLWLDIKILWRTVWAVISRRGSY